MNEETGKCAQQLLKNIEDVMEKRNPIKDINLFSILGMETKEVSAHSAFLYYIFKPFEKDDANLRALYDFLRIKKISKTKMQDLPANPKYLDIFREVSTDKGRFDFLIRYDNDAIVIELKVFAGEQEDQIKRYSDYLRDNDYTEDNVFFLTRKGVESKTGNSIEISLKQVCQVLNDIGNNRGNDYKVIIDQYVKIIKKITEDNKYMENSEVIKNREDIIATDVLIEVKKYHLTQVLKKFLEQLEIELLNIINNDDLSMFSLYKTVDEIAFQSRDNYYIGRKATWPAIMFDINDTGYLRGKYLENAKTNKSDDIDDLEVLFYVEIDNFLFSGFTLRSNKVHKESYSSIFLKEDDGNIKYFKTDSWLSWEYAKLNGDKINFKEYANKSDGVLRLLKENSLEVDNDAIKYIAEDIVRSFKAQYAGLLERLS